jgi:hypothetical protein
MIQPDRTWGDGLAHALATMPDLCERLLHAHTPDHHGRCRACTRGGTGIPGDPWPCSIRCLAVVARRFIDGAAAA